jgi:hypothetical protein
MGWVDTFRKLKVSANADTPTEAKVAREFGVKQVGSQELRKSIRMAPVKL